MVHIQDLPLEILNRIFYYVFPPRNSPSFLNDEGVFANEGAFSNPKANKDETDGTAIGLFENEDLCRLCLVSRTFRDIAQPILFHTFADDNLDHGDLRRTISFAKTIYRRPELGEHVKDIAYLFVPIKRKPKKLPADDAKLCKSAIQALELGDQEEKRWISLMRSYDFGVIVALLVLKTPHLRGFSLAGDIDIATWFKPLFARDPSFLSELTSLHIKGQPRGYNLKIYEDFITRPNLQHLTLEYCDFDDASFPSTWTPGSLAVETLFIRYSHIDGAAIRKLMQACKKLTEFAYQNFSPYSEEMRPETSVTSAHFTAAQVHEAALMHKDTLGHFHVEFARSQSDFQNIQRYLSSRVKFGSFREFTALESMMVPHAYLSVNPELPHALKQIEITDCNSSIQNMAQNIAKDAKKGLYPELLEVTVLTIDVRDPIKLPGGRIPPNKTPEDCFLGLRDLFKGTKVEFNISPYVVDDVFDDDDDMPLEMMDQMPPELLQILMQGAPGPLGGARGPPGGPRGPPAGARPPPRGPPGRNEMPPGLLDLLMEQAMRDPDFAHLRPPGR
ncbi:uncharacterized protein N7484_002986 [Penicillium longicatenatum]|uniref:uncharacterized protein n=1 Tax=Penicillium longicatenatum TaxID=1561947 RepID=UPI002548A59E|nr:uncharacterized protein N7484_002986 [Penicillium longicatenatum]KAJ5649263.1 hypothetical protein N7484_002986 [Penicillium longicatenatum]